jgi:exodeoxyribonuclease VII small subunit
MPKKKTDTFEEGYARVQALVEAMENGSMPLDKTFEAYEQAVALIKSLNAMLDMGECKIEMLTNGVVRDITEEADA